MAPDRARDNVLKIQYVKILRGFLSFVCAWPGDELGQKLHWLSKCYRVYLPFQSLGIWSGEIHYMVTNDLDLLALGDCILTFFLTTVLLIRLFIPLTKRYGEVVRDFFMDFHLMHFKHKGIHFGKVHDIVEKVCYYCTIYMVVITICAAIFFNVTPIYLNYKNGAFSQQGKGNIMQFSSSVYISYPFLNPFDYIKILTAYNFYCSFICGTAVCALDLLVILMAFHITGHIVILRKNLVSITGPEKSVNLILRRKNFIVAFQYEVFSEDENRKVSLMLKDCVEHHRTIVRFTNKMSDFFGVMLAFNYTLQLVGCCILLLESTQVPICEQFSNAEQRLYLYTTCNYMPAVLDLNALIRFGPLTLIIFGQLIQISVIFEIIGTVSEKLPDALYSIPWECLDISNQRSVCILLQRLQRPIRVTAMGMTTVGVTTMAGILKTTFSYFAFLRSLNE